MWWINPLSANHVYVPFHMFQPLSLYLVFKEGEMCLSIAVYCHMFLYKSRLSK